jgi:hypothetical protein
MKRMLVVPLALAAVLALLLFMPQSKRRAYERPPLPTPVVLDEVGELPPGAIVEQQSGRPARVRDGLKAWR